MHRRSYERWAMKYAFPWKRAVTRPSYSRIPPRPLKRGRISSKSPAALPRHSQPHIGHKRAETRQKLRVLDSWLRAIKEKRKRNADRISPDSAALPFFLSPPRPLSTFAGTMPPFADALILYPPIPRIEEIWTNVIHSWFLTNFEI